MQQIVCCTAEFRSPCRATEKRYELAPFDAEHGFLRGTGNRAESGLSAQPIAPSGCDSSLMHYGILIVLTARITPALGSSARVAFQTGARQFPQYPNSGRDHSGC